MLLHVKQLNGFLVPQFPGAVFTHKNLIWVDKKQHLWLSFLSTTTYVKTEKIEGGHLPRVPCVCLKF